LKLKSRTKSIKIFPVDELELSVGSICIDMNYSVSYEMKRDK
jgi:hypothetical protein